MRQETGGRRQEAGDVTDVIQETCHVREETRDRRQGQETGEVRQEI